MMVQGTASAQVDPDASPQPAQQAAPTAAPFTGNVPDEPVSASYRINPGDVLNVTVFGEPNLTQPLTTVLDDGTIVYPLVGRIHVGGDTTTQADTALSRALQKYVRNPIVSVTVSSAGRISVLVLGNVKLPGKYAVRPDARLSDAIAASGGLGPVDGAFPVARVTEPDGTLKTASLQSLFKDGDASQNIRVANNAIVYVNGPQSFHVQVLGSVERTGYVDVDEGQRLSVVIARAGVSNQVHPDLNHVTITRVDPDGVQRAHVINMYEALQNGDLRYDPVMKKGDLVFVPQNKYYTGNDLGAGAILRRLIGF
jgi:polysaccharide export outer membrane protein